MSHVCNLQSMQRFIFEVVRINVSRKCDEYLAKRMYSYVLSVSIIRRKLSAVPRTQGRARRADHGARGAVPARRPGGPRRPQGRKRGGGRDAVDGVDRSVDGLAAAARVRLLGCN